MSRVVERLISRYSPVAHALVWSGLLFAFAQLGRIVAEIAPSMKGIVTVSIGIAYLLVAAAGIGFSVAHGRLDVPGQEQLGFWEVMGCVLCCAVLLLLSALAGWFIAF